MLSRVAESLYWTARYVERAELVSRLVHVSFDSLLDADPGGGDKTWRRLLQLVGVDEIYREHHEAYTAESASEFLLWGPDNPSAVTVCISRARENARGVRDQISTEMWEELNRLHLYLADTRLQGVIHAQHRQFVRVRQGSDGFQGAMRSTLPRGEPYELLRLGTHMERADMTARILAVEYPPVVALPVDTLAETAELTFLLKLCGAFEAFRKAESSWLRAPGVLEYLLLDRGCPRTVLFCLEGCRRSLEAIGAADRPERAIGRLTSELLFLEFSELERERLQNLLVRVLRGIASAGDEIASAFFTTQAVVPGAYAQAQQQQ